MTNKPTETAAFTVSNLDLSGISDDDLIKQAKPRYLKEPGKYVFSITRVSMYEGKEDAAGKKWGSLHVTAAEQESGDLLSFFMDVPVETTLYTSKLGTTSKTKTQIFANLIRAVTGNQVRTADLPSIVSNLSSILAEGTRFRASVKYKNDHIKFNADDKNFNIIMKDGTTMVDENGDVLAFEKYEDGVNYYSQIKGRRPAAGLEVSTFLTMTEDAERATA